VLVVAAIVLTVPACGGGSHAAPSPAPTAQLRTGILAPAGRARDTVNQLNNLQNQQEQQTGGGNYNP
jgi:hypothetical protein